ncbi:MAG: hypothetical protein ACRDVZ_09580 [Jiangellaceae bacterium]
MAVLLLAEQGGEPAQSGEAFVEGERRPLRVARTARSRRGVDVIASVRQPSGSRRKLSGGG